MGDIVPVGAGGSNALVAHKHFDPEKELEAYEMRLKEAQQLEEKLRKINDDVPTRVFNVMGSCAGAGSGDFHHYRQVRRAEQDRVKRMEEEYDREQKEKEHEERVKQLQQQAEERTAKRRAKRQKKKAKKRSKTGGDGAGDNGQTAQGEASSEEEGDGPEHAALD